jgi:hypothetical protein
MEFEPTKIEIDYPKPLFNHEKWGGLIVIIGFCGLKKNYVNWSSFHASFLLDGVAWSNKWSLGSPGEKCGVQSITEYYFSKPVGLFVPITSICLSSSNQTCFAGKYCFFYMFLLFLMPLFSWISHCHVWFLEGSPLGWQPGMPGTSLTISSGE